MVHGEVSPTPDRCPNIENRIANSLAGTDLKPLFTGQVGFSGEDGMTKNMGWLDRGIRTLIAIAIGVLYFTDQISGVVAVVLGIVALAFLVTSFVAWCPAYLPFNLSTRKSSGGVPGGESGSDV